MRTFRMGGVHPADKKISKDAAIERLPLPKTVYISMGQHLGAPAEPCVAVGDKVKVGQLIANPTGFVSAPVHSSVSGTVKSIEMVKDLAGRAGKAVVIDVEGDEWMEDIDRSQDIVREIKLDKKEIVDRIKACGVVGLGGATFPTNVKLSPPPTATPTCVIINGAECEPYLSSDYREMMERPQDMIDGIKLCLDLSGVPTSLICIEDNKPKAIDLLRKLAADDPRIQVLELPARYPQGASRVILKNATGRAVPAGGHLTDVGAILFNCTTMGEIARYVRTGMPLIQRRITVMGDAVANPQNLMVYVGTPTGEVLEYCGLSCEPAKVIAGGPMMGNTQIDMEYPIIRQQSGLLAFSEAMCGRRETTACIHCDKCISSCPMRLSPVNIQKAYRKGDVAQLDALHADICVGCGICSYVCPAKQPLTQSVGLAGKLLKAEKRKAKGRR